MSVKSDRCGQFLIELTIVTVIIAITYLTVVLGERTEEVRPFIQLAKALRQGADIPRSLEKIQIRWEPQGFSSTAGSLKGQIIDPTFDSDTGGWLFPTNKTAALYLIGRMPHSWREGSAIYPVVHWEKTTSAPGNVLWRWQVQVSRIGEVRSAGYTDYDSTTIANLSPDQNLAKYHLLTTFGEIVPEDLQIGDLLIMRIGRVPGEAEDTYGANALYFYMDIYMQRDDWGSTAPTRK